MEMIAEAGGVASILDWKKVSLTLIRNSGGHVKLYLLFFLTAGPSSQIRRICAISFRGSISK